jgi:hypothetical protein
VTCRTPAGASWNVYDFELYNKPAGCGISGGISYRNPTLKKNPLSFPRNFILLTESAAYSCVQQPIIEAYPDVYKILLVFILKKRNKGILGRLILNN